jgi:hypothetical protein
LYNSLDDIWINEECRTKCHPHIHYLLTKKLICLDMRTDTSRQTQLVDIGGGNAIASPAVSAASLSISVVQSLVLMFAYSTNKSLIRPSAVDLCYYGNLLDKRVCPCSALLTLGSICITGCPRETPTIIYTLHDDKLQTGSMKVTILALCRATDHLG